MKERPILFSAPMIRAILREIEKPGTGKTVTRRIIAKPNRFGILSDLSEVVEVIQSEPITEWWHLKAKDGIIGSIQCSYGQPRDRLWVRENTWIWCRKVANGTTKTGRQKFKYMPDGQHVIYCADHSAKPAPINGTSTLVWKFKPGRYMPRWASRLTLEVTGVRVERLQDITEEDARAEGANPSDWEYQNGECCETAREAFQCLWESINGPGSWDANPWVWVIGFQPLGGRGFAGNFRVKGRE